MDRVEFSPAKINLNLHILGRQPDGYHALFSLVCFADYGDKLTFTVGGCADGLEVRGPFGSDITGENIILKASALLRDEVKGLPFGTFTLEKNLPVASGMGGGSANAAAALRLLSDYVPDDFADDFTAQRWQKIALQLGADVPVCLQGETVYMSGIGEKLTAATGVPSCYGVLVNPLIGVSTAKVFQKLAAAPYDIKNSTQTDTWFDPKIQSFEHYLSATHNDLEKPALQIAPVIKEVITALQQQEGCFLSRMSGSGATCFGLFETSKMANDAVVNIKEYSNNWWIKSALLG